MPHMADRSKRRHVRETHPVDEQAESEGNAIKVLGTLCLQKAGSHVTSSIPWVPKKPSGKRGWLAMSERQRLRAGLVRGKSNHTPKLAASYARACDRAPYGNA